jgi:hypothetical protein
VWGRATQKMIVLYLQTEGDYPYVKQCLPYNSRYQ